MQDRNYQASFTWEGGRLLCVPLVSVIDTCGSARGWGVASGKSLTCWLCESAIDAFMCHLRLTSVLPLSLSSSYLSTLRNLFSGDTVVDSSCPQPCLYDFIPPAIWPDFLFCREILYFLHLSTNVLSLALPGQGYFYLFIIVCILIFHLCWPFLKVIYVVGLLFLIRPCRG